MAIDGGKLKCRIVNEITRLNGSWIAVAKDIRGQLLTGTVKIVKYCFRKNLANHVLTIRLIRTLSEKDCNFSSKPRFGFIRSTKFSND